MGRMTRGKRGADINLAGSACASGSIIHTTEPHATKNPGTMAGVCCGVWPRPPSSWLFRHVDPRMPWRELRLCRTCVVTCAGLSIASLAARFVLRRRWRGRLRGLRGSWVRFLQDCGAETIPAPLALTYVDRATAVANRQPGVHILLRGAT